MNNCQYLDPHHKIRCTECGATTDLCLCVDVPDLAHHRLTSAEGRMTRLIANEIKLAQKKFPGNRHMLCALMEEVGELAQVIMQHDRGEGTTAKEIVREAIQVAAMAIRLGTEGDEAFLYDPVSIFGEESI